MSDEPSDAEVDALYELHPDEFVAARNALAKDVSKSKRDKDAARRIEKLRKPTQAAWALNTVARQRPADVEELLRIGREMRRAQQGALAGDEPEDLRNAVERRRRLVRRLGDEAGALTADSHRDDIHSTLEAASVDDDVGEELRRGRLTNAHQRPSGFDVLAGMDGAGTPPSRSQKKDRSSVKRLERRLRRADDALERSQDQLERAEEKLAAARAKADAARAAVQERAAERDEIASELAAEER